jgi:hypothetical protein
MAAGLMAGPWDNISLEALLDPAALAEGLGCDPRQPRRLLDLDHRSRLDQLEAALTALGKRLVLEVRDAA